MVQQIIGMFSAMGDYKDRLGQAMRAAGVTPAALAAELKVSYQAVKQVIDGKNTSFTAVNNDKAARFLGVNSRWLATGEGDRAARDDSQLSPLALDLAAMLDSIPEGEKRQQLYAICAQVLQVASTPVAPALPEPALKPSRKPVRSS
jgi:hypothetical protein